MLLYKLLRLQLSPWQLAGFVLANCLGLVVVLFGVQFYSDVAPVFTAGDSFMKEEYVVVTKEVGLANMMGRGAPVFTDAEVADIAAQPFVDGCAPFTGATFSVVAAVSSPAAGVGFQTEMFLEALPDNYVDTDLARWHYTPGNPQVPIVIPRNYLNLYNFGFASGRGLPAVSEGMVGLVPIRLYLSGAGGSVVVEGRVTGFSNRLNTILVPLAFMQWANDTLSPGLAPKATRLCIDVSNPADPRLGQFLTQRGYRTEGTGGDAGRMAFFLRVVCYSVVLVGVAICLLAFFVMLLSVYLLLQKNLEKIRTLRLVGYSVRAVSLPYLLLICAVYALGLLAASPALRALRGLYMEQIGVFTGNYATGLAPAVDATALLLTLLLTLLSAAATLTRVRRCL
ncbi:MAG: ABC transporter permease [Bacteroidaceae bacterium]|nr:ABC transporter permease [Bacteroidaceae bacterium]